MKEWKNVLLPGGSTIVDALNVIDQAGYQVALIVDQENRLLGSITDGDVRRGMLRKIPLESPVEKIMNHQPQVTGPDVPLREMLQQMETARIRQLPIVNQDNQLIGLRHIEEAKGAEDKPGNWTVIMAGGLGTRLRPLTEDTPKPMLLVGERPVLETTIDRMTTQGFSRFYISVNYMANQIIEHFGSGAEHGADIRYLHEKEPLGTAGALSLIDEKPDQPIIVLNGDLLTSVSFKTLLEYHVESGCKATMAVREYDFEVPFGVVSFEDNLVTEIDEKPIHRMFVNAGMYVLEPEVLELVPADTRSDMTEIVDHLLSSGETVSAFPVREAWLDIGRKEDLEVAVRQFGNPTGSDQNT